MTHTARGCEFAPPGKRLGNFLETDRLLSVTARTNIRRPFPPVKARSANRRRDVPAKVAGQNTNVRLGFIRFPTAGGSGCSRVLGRAAKVPLPRSPFCRGRAFSFAPTDPQHPGTAAPQSHPAL